MRKILLPILTMLLYSSCLPKHGTKVKQDSESDNKFTIYTFIDDVEKHLYEYQTSPLNINTSVIDSSYIIEYVKRKNIQVRGDVKKILLVFNVSNSMDIQTLGEIVNLCDKTIKTHNSDLVEIVEIQFLYSSKNNDWLILPIPPKL